MKLFLILGFLPPIPDFVLCKVLFKYPWVYLSICIEMFEDIVSKTKNLLKNFMFKK